MLRISKIRDFEIFNCFGLHEGWVVCCGYDTRWRGKASRGRVGHTPQPRCGVGDRIEHTDKKSR